jgi:hypothetical protein
MTRAQSNGADESRMAIGGTAAAQRAGDLPSRHAG